MNDDNDLVSVALCTHNGGRFIRDQIRSICMGEQAPHEIVISDDASTDDCILRAEAAVNECLKENPKLRILLKILKNSLPLGVTKNFQQAVLECRGSLIALCDQDDVWMPERLSKMLLVFEARPELVLLHSDATLVDSACKPLGLSLFHALEVTSSEISRIHSGEGFDVLLRRNLVTGATTLFRRSLLCQAAPFPAEWVHDEWLAIIAAAVGKIDVVEDELVKYRQHDANQIGARKITFEEKIRKAIAPRGDTHVKRALKATLLLDRLLSLTEVSEEKIQKVRSKIEHQQFRALLPKARTRRIFPVFREFSTGRYNEFGRGFRGIVRDLLESV